MGKVGLGVCSEKRTQRAYFDDFSVKSVFTIAENREHNAVNEVVSIGGASLLYDADGNLTDDGEREYSWDALNRLVSVSDKEGSMLAAYTYDTDNNMRSRTTSDGTQTYVY